VRAVVHAWRTSHRAPTAPPSSAAAGRDETEVASLPRTTNRKPGVRCSSRTARQRPI
ncbi:unnamed protein product, partial [Symbiodinium microadriaticum]